MTRLRLLLAAVAPSLVIAAAVACSHSYADEGEGADAGDGGSSEAAPDASARSDDAATPPSVTEDAAPADGGPAACDVGKPFTAPLEIAGLAQGDWVGASIFPASGELFTSVRPPNGTFALAVLPPATGGGFGSPYVLSPPVFGPTSVAQWPAISPDGKVLYFTVSSTVLDIGVSTRSSAPSGTFSQPTMLSLGSAFDPFYDGTALWYAADGLAASHLYRVEVDPVTGMATGNKSMVLAIAGSRGPVVSADGLTMYYGHMVEGGVDHRIFVTRRADAAKPFDEGVEAAELDAAGDNLPASLSSDGCTIYLLSHRSGLYRLMRATRSP